MVNKYNMGNTIGNYSLFQKVSSISFAILGIVTLALTSSGITGNIIRNNSISVDSDLLGFSLGILLIAISAMFLIKKNK